MLVDEAVGAGHVGPGVALGEVGARGAAERLRRPALIGDAVDHRPGRIGLARQRIEELDLVVLGIVDRAALVAVVALDRVEHEPDLDGLAGEGGQADRGRGPPDGAVRQVGAPAGHRGKGGEVVKVV